MSSGAARSSCSSGSGSGSAKIQYVQQDFEPEYESVGTGFGSGTEGASNSNYNNGSLTKTHSQMSQMSTGISTPYNSKTRLFNLQSREEESQFDVSVLRAIVSGISKALSGDSVVTAPALSRGFDWLGRIIVKPGPLEGPYYRRHRTYRVQGQILAGGHVLPWRIGRSWRYSELHTLLVEDLCTLVNTFSLQPHYAELISHFPPKNWQNRNSEETAEFRGAAIEAYVLRGIEITSMLLDSIPVEARLTKKQIERNKKRQRQRRRQRLLRRELVRFL
uniref:Uncharacterized protein n=1 Tax=Aplanochytrium stocchinoi TaxID=215587 RepID=A0A7S3V117_9STRA